MSFKNRPVSCATHLSQYVLSWLGAFIIVPLIVPILGFLWVYRSVVRVIVKLQPLTPYDCIFAVDTYYTRPFASNLTVLELKSRVSVAEVAGLFVDRVLENRSFTKLCCVPVEVLGYWFWKPINIDKNTVVSVFHDSELHDFRSVDECLRNIVEMKYTRQLFNVCLLHYGNTSYVVFRIHHTVCDGYSFNHLIDNFVGKKSKHLVKQTKLSASSVFVDAVKWIRLLSHLPFHVCTLYKESLTHTPNYYTLPKTSTTGYIRRTIFPLDELKKIRRNTNTHFASIGMSLMTGALQKLYDETNETSLRPKSLSIMHSLPKPNHPVTSLCNHWGVGLFKVPFLKNPVNRLVEAEADFNEYEELQFDRLIHLHMPIIGVVPAVAVKWFFSINFGTGCGFTSVPGLFDNVAYVGGAQVAHMWKVFGLQWKQSAVAVAMYTYGGEGSMSFYVNKDIIGSESLMDRLMNLLHIEFKELSNYK